MPIVGTPTTPTVISRDQVRMFMRDRADNNILLAEVQFTDRELDLALEMTANAYNAVTPQSNLTPSTFPNKYVLLVGTVRFLLMSESFMQVRNQATVQDGDVSPIGIDDKAALYAQMAQSLKAEFDELVRGIKTELNMYSGFDGMGSGYVNVTRFNR